MKFPTLGLLAGTRKLYFSQKVPAAHVAFAGLAIVVTLKMELGSEGIVTKRDPLVSVTLCNALIATSTLAPAVPFAALTTPSIAAGVVSAPTTGVSANRPNAVPEGTPIATLAA